jgi:molecular chaperone GrpE
MTDPMANKASPEPDTISDDAAAADAAAPDPVAALEAERADLKDKLLRTLAEMENLRRRTEREVADAKAYAVTGFARDMLSVADNLRRALESFGTAAVEGPAKTLAEGVDLTEREMLKTFEKHGVKKIEPLGEKFDPNLHQAMFEAPDPTQPKGHVVAVVQAGFSIGERVLRPALVGVSSGAPKVDAPAGADGPANG